jgi:hypothetical protein
MCHQTCYLLIKYYSFRACSYIQYIYQQMHLIQQNKIQIINFQRVIFVPDAPSLKLFHYLTFSDGSKYRCEKDNSSCMGQTRMEN